MRTKLVTYLSLLLLPGFVFAAAATDKLIVPIGDLAGSSVSDVTIGTYVSKLYTWSIGIGAALALLMIVVGALQYTLAAGSIGTKDDAKKRITGAVFGLVLLLGAVTILTTLSPSFGTVGVESPKAISAEMAKKRATEAENTLLSFNFATGNMSDYAAAKEAIGTLESLIGTGISQEDFNTHVTMMYNEIVGYYSNPANIAGYSPEEVALQKYNTYSAMMIDLDQRTARVLFNSGAPIKYDQDLVNEYNKELFRASH